MFNLKKGTRSGWAWAPMSCGPCLGQALPRPHRHLGSSPRTVNKSRHLPPPLGLGRGAPFPDQGDLTVGNRVPLNSSRMFNLENKVEVRKDKFETDKKQATREEMNVHLCPHIRGVPHWCSRGPLSPEGPHPASTIVPRETRISDSDESFWSRAYSKILFVVYLKFQFNSASCIFIC